MTCETKLHINTVTSDILRALQKAEMRVDVRDRSINQLQKNQYKADLRVAKEKRCLNETVASNKLKTDGL